MWHDCSKQNELGLTLGFLKQSSIDFQLALVTLWQQFSMYMDTICPSRVTCHNLVGNFLFFYNSDPYILPLFSVGWKSLCRPWDHHGMKLLIFYVNEIRCIKF
jgi:hypothetical protein